MEKISAGKKYVFLAVLLGLFFVCIAGLAAGDGTDKQNTADADMTGEFRVLADSGFYLDDLEIEVQAPAGAKVYYRMDGGQPGPGSGQVYDGPILLEAGEEEKITVIRFRALYEDGSFSETITRNYFVGRQIRQRYQSVVLSIAGDPEGLFGYEEGILVPGIRYDEFLRENPGVHPGGGVEANYTLRGREAEREVSLEMFDADGKEVFSLNGGIRVVGQLSRLNQHKSLRLYARREYDEVNNKFRSDFFGDLYSLQDGTLGQKYKRLQIKNSGQDYGYGFVRNELVNRLADQAGFPDTLHVAPVCVYINGMYYGSCWLCSNYDDQYFENRYGIFDGTFEILEGGDREKYVSEDADPQERDMTEEFNARYDYFAGLDYTVEENFRELSEFMDVENYLQYFAIENYVGNDDWPDANLKTYRYRAGESGYGEGVFDGRYRMLLFDADYGFGLTFYHDTIGTLVNEMTLDKIMYDKSPLFAALMEREECREYFVSYTLDLMNGVMRAENVGEQVDELHLSHQEELRRTVETPGLTGGLLLEEQQINMEAVENNVQRIKDYAAARPQYILQDIEEKFGYGQQYELTVVSQETTNPVKINSMYCEDSVFTGTFLKEVPVHITPCPNPGESFQYWIVNGVIREDEELILQGEDIGGDAVEVELVMRDDGEPRLQICAVAAKGQKDYVELVNLSSQTVSTEEYYLTDDDDPYKYTLPAIVLQPGEKLRLVGKDNRDADSLGSYGFNFNLRQGETVTLTYGREPADSVRIPDLSEDGVYVRDFQRGVYIERKQEYTAE